jgi:hypothetical protein
MPYQIFQCFSAPDQNIIAVGRDQNFSRAETVVVIGDIAVRVNSAIQLQLR